MEVNITSKLEAQVSDTLKTVLDGSAILRFNRLRSVISMLSFVLSLFRQLLWSATNNTSSRNVAAILWHLMGE